MGVLFMCNVKRLFHNYNICKITVLILILCINICKLNLPVKSTYHWKLYTFMAAWGVLLYSVHVCAKPDNVFHIVFYKTTCFPDIKIIQPSVTIAPNIPYWTILRCTQKLVNKTQRWAIRIFGNFEQNLPNYLPTSSFFSKWFSVIFAPYVWRLKTSTCTFRANSRPRAENHAIVKQRAMAILAEKKMANSKKEASLCSTMNFSATWTLLCEGPMAKVKVNKWFLLTSFL